MARRGERSGRVHFGTPMNQHTIAYHYQGAAYVDLSFSFRTVGKQKDGTFTSRHGSTGPVEVINVFDYRAGKVREDFDPENVPEEVRRWAYTTAGESGMSVAALIEQYVTANNGEGW